jgi:hypothetical protein
MITTSGAVWNQRSEMHTDIGTRANERSSEQLKHQAPEKYERGTTAPHFRGRNSAADVDRFNSRFCR